MIWMLTILFSIQLFYAYAYRYRRQKQSDVQPESYPRVSILICGKNEAQNFVLHLPFILEQEYELNQFEVVAVNDASNDDSALVLSSLAEQFPKLNILNIAPQANRTFPGKKFALLEGLKFCKYELVLLTDADCKPASKHWLQTMAEAYASNRPLKNGNGFFVLGYGAYQNEKGNLNRFVRWETRHTFMQYASWTMMGLPYMAVGRNVMYEKTPVLQLLEQDISFEQIFAQTASGDDDLIISALANSQNSIIVDAAASHTISLAPQNWQQWWGQKTRHVSSGKYYSFIIKAGLGLYAISAFLFWPLLIYMLVTSKAYIQIIVLILGLIRLLFYWANAFRWSSVLDKGKTAWFYPIGEWMWLIYNFAVSPFIFWKNKKQWK